MLDATSPLVHPPAAEARLDVAMRRLRVAIVSCEIPPGAFVHEAGLAERFGLGRASIRVALTELAAARFVSRHARQGWRIAPIDGALVAAVLDGRRRLEFALALHKLTEPVLSAATSLLGIVQSVSGRKEPAALATARASERQLRNLLAAGAGVFAGDWLADIWDHSDRIVRMLDLSGHAVAPADLAELVAALGAGELDLARQAIEREHTRFADAIAHGFLVMSAQPARPQARSARRRALPSPPPRAPDRATPPPKEKQS